MWLRNRRARRLHQDRLRVLFMLRACHVDGPYMAYEIRNLTFINSGRLYHALISLEGSGEVKRMKDAAGRAVYWASEGAWQEQEKCEVRGGVLGAPPDVCQKVAGHRSPMHQGRWCSWRGR